MRVCVLGAGAIGGLIGGRLALAGEEVTLLGLGPHFDALRSDGLEIVRGDGRVRVRDFRAVDTPEEAGPQDVVFLAVKAYDIHEVAPRLPSLYGPDTVVVTLQNGIPWWYFQRHGGPLDGRRLETLDPGGQIRAHVPPERIVGCIAYPAAVVPEPGVVRHVEGSGLPLGELDGSETPRLVALGESLRAAGFKSWVLSDVRAEIWLKAWGSLSFNPVSALTGATLEEICRFPGTRGLVRRLMEEAKAVSDALGVRVRRSVEERISGGERVGPHKTSMLQDTEHGRRLEVEALVGTVLELAELTSTPAPALEAVYGLIGLLDRSLRKRGGRRFVGASPPGAAGGSEELAEMEPETAS